MIPAMPPPHQRTEAVFVGRHDELVELRAGLEDAVSGRGRFFLVVGEAGTGKTRLVEELARDAGQREGVALSLGYEPAATHFQDALDALGRARPADEGERCELLLARGDAQARSGDGRGARQTFRAAADIARRLGDAALLARSALGFAGEGSRLLWVQSGVVDQPRVDLLGPPGAR